MTEFVKNKVTKKKLIWEMYASFIIASLLPIALIVGFFINKSIDSTEQNLIQMAEPYCTQVVDNIASVISGTENEIEILKNSNAIYTLLFSEYTNPADALTMYQTQWLQNTKHMIRSSHTVKFYNTADNSIIASLTNNTLEDFKRIYGENATQAGVGIHYKLLPSYGSLPLRLGMYTSFASVDRQLFLTIEVPITEIMPYLEGGNSLGGFVYLIDIEGNILCSSDHGNVYTGMITKSFLDSIGDSHSVHLNGEKVLTIAKPLSSYTSLTSECSQWKLLYLMPNELFQKSMHRNLLSIVPLCLCCMLFSLGVAIGFTTWVCGRLNKLRNKTKRILNADFNIAEPISSNDELAELEASIYEMAAALETMLANQYQRLQQENAQKIRNEQLLRTTIQAEINALRYQINPHYLFNTMEAIRMHLYLKGDRETANIIRLFSESFRKMLAADDSEYSLLDELDTVESYIQVQKYRLGDRFTSQIIVDPAIRNCIIPKLLIQPLVENAFFHGIELSERFGQLRVVFSLQNSRLHIQVMDNGIGMSAERLNSLRNNLEDPDSASRVGLVNIVRRLNLLYGDNKSFNIESEQGKGTTIDVEIPYQIQEKGSSICESANR